MSKLYAVTAGEYSDYHIITICSNKEKAEEICKLYNRGDPYYDASIEEYEDGVRVDLNRPIFKVTIDGPLLKESGLAFMTTEELTGSDKINSLFDTSIYTLNRVVYKPYFDTFTVVVSAENNDLAEKIAIDLVAEFKANRCGIV
jgi:hypothetical protein